MGDSVFRKLQKILEKPKPPAYMRQSDYQVEIPWYRRLWISIRLPAAVPSGRKLVSRSQRRMLWITAAVVLPVVAGGWVYEYVSRAPMRAGVAYDAAMKLQGANDFGGAVAKFSESLGFESSPQVYLQRGNAYRELGQEKKALEDWAQAIALNPRMSEVFTARGTYYRLIGDSPKALEDLNQSLRLEPSVDAHYQRGQVFALLGQFDKAIEDYGRAIELRREAPYVYLARSVAKRALGDESGFEEDQKIALELQH